MKKTNKKGFTIVELVIVIAVVAILAAVLIPTFVSVTKRANESKDTQLVRNLNTALAVDTEVGKHATMDSALKAAADAGYDVAKINVSAKGNEILWDSANDCFAYLKDNKVEYIPETNLSVKDVKNYQYWVIASTPNATYSTYLYGGKDGSVAQTFDNVKTGIDVGNENVTSITYVGNGSKQDVVIRTNSFDTTVNVNAETDVVNHYGEAKEINIAKVATSSYHEYGEVAGNINLAYGRVELKANSSVSNIVVKAIDDVTPESDNVKVSVETGANANLVISEVAGVSVAVDGAGASTVSKIENISGKVAAIGSETFESIEAALNSARDNETITLVGNGCLNSEYPVNKNITIDLNDNQLTITKIKVSSGHNAILKNGKVESTLANNLATSQGFVVFSNAGLRLSHIDYSGACYGIFPSGDASFVDIYNSNIKAIVGIATSAAKGVSHNVKINIESSIIDASADGEEIGVWINVPGLLTINNSVIKGNYQALMVRAGTAVVSNSELIMTNNGKADPEIYLSGNSKWGSGNIVPHATLIVGDWSGSYPDSASCTLYNTKVSTQRTDWTRALTVLAQQGSCETSFDYDNSCGIKTSDYLVCNYAVSGLKKGLITVNGTVIQQREQ